MMQFREIVFQKFIPVILLVSVAGLLTFSCSKTDTSKRFSVIEIYAEGCEPCIKSEESFNALKTEYGQRIKFVTYDVNSPEGQMLVKAHSLKVIPSMLVLNDIGVELYRHEGAFTVEEITPILKSISRL